MHWLNRFKKMFRSKPKRQMVKCDYCSKVVTQRVTGQLFKHKCARYEIGVDDASTPIKLEGSENQPTKNPTNQGDLC